MFLIKNVDFQNCIKVVIIRNCMSIVQGHQVYNCPFYREHPVDFLAYSVPVFTLLIFNTFFLVWIMVVSQNLFFLVWIMVVSQNLFFLVWIMVVRQNLFFLVWIMVVSQNMFFLVWIMVVRQNLFFLVWIMVVSYNLLEYQYAYYSITTNHFTLN